MSLHSQDVSAGPHCTLWIESNSAETKETNRRNKKMAGAMLLFQPRLGWTRPRDVYGIIAFQSTGLRECMGKAVRFSAQFHHR